MAINPPKAVNVIIRYVITDLASLKSVKVQILMIRKYFSLVIFEKSRKIIITPGIEEEKEIRHFLPVSLDTDRLFLEQKDSMYQTFK